MNKRFSEKKLVVHSGELQSVYQ